ncbi:hypothetical protein [Saccharothrix stipae]
MRILGRLAVSAGATAVILLAAPAANASPMDAVPGGSPLAAAQQALGAVVGQLSNGLGGLGGLGGGLPGGLGG